MAVSSLAMSLLRGGLEAHLDHVAHGGTHLRVGEVGHAAARGHLAVALDGGAHQRVDAVAGAIDPRRAVADLRRAGDPGAVALHAAHRDDLLAAALLRFGGLDQAREGQRGEAAEDSELSHGAPPRSGPTIFSIW